MNDPTHPHILTYGESAYTPLGSRIANELDAAILAAHRRVWRKHRSRITRKEFRVLAKEAATFRGSFPMADAGKEWSP